MLMRNVELLADSPGTVIVGDVVFHITRISEQRLSIGIVAPKDLLITASWREKSKTVEP
jgi:sRNA-binding carbon storage regulator CsrA